MLLFIVLVATDLLILPGFNTSHVTLYRRCQNNGSNRPSFQYISCYSLSLQCRRNAIETYRFNTSHVTLYQTQPADQPITKTGFNTSHVTLYPISMSLSFVMWASFNTSHVTLYHAGRMEPGDEQWFQYISCYSLSVYLPPGQQRRGVSIHLMLLFIGGEAGYEAVAPMFQYISCYSLSRVSLLVRFSPLLFQYISCYSLSSWPDTATWRESRFNTSHVTLYRRLQSWKLTSTSVSIHLILLFIRRKKDRQAQRNRFNTSHVTLYPSTLQHFSHLTFL